MAGYHPPTADRAGKLRLDFNENTGGCSPKVVAGLRNALSRDLLSIYPEYERADAKLAEFFGVGADQILITSGSDDALRALTFTYVDPGDTVLLARPTFSMFRFYAEAAGGTVHELAYAEPDLRFPFEAFLAAAEDGPKLIEVATPNNPTGDALSLDQIEQLVAAAPRAAVLIDEAYFDFWGVTALGLLPKYPNLFITRTFSKSWGLAGMRLGVLLSQAENMAYVRRQQSPYGVNWLSLIAALLAIEDPAYRDAYVATALASRARLAEFLSSQGLRVYPSEANFVLAQFGPRSKEIAEAVRAEGVLVRERSADVPGTIRITAGSEDEMSRLIKILESVLPRYR